MYKLVRNYKATDFHFPRQNQVTLERCRRVRQYNPLPPPAVCFSCFELLLLKSVLQAVLMQERPFKHIFLSQTQLSETF